MRKNFGTNPYFFPLPVLIVGSYDGDGNANAMNAAWGGLYDADQVILCLSAGHKTTQNILKNGGPWSLRSRLPHRARPALCWAPLSITRR